MIVYNVTDLFTWPQLDCAFPEWMTGYRMRDLADRRVLFSSQQGQVLHLANSARSTNSRPGSDVTLRCLRPIAINITSRHFMAISFTSDGW